MLLEPDSADLEVLLEEFSLFPKLFRLPEAQACTKRERLMRLINERLLADTPTGRMRFAFRLGLQCPEIVSECEIVRNEIEEGFAIHADARSSNVREEDFFTDNGERLNQQRHVTRRQKTLRNIINSAFSELDKKGRPKQFQRDHLRAVLVSIGQEHFGFTKTEALRFAAGKEDHLNGGIEVAAKRPYINIGTDRRPKYYEGAACSLARPTGAPSERFEPANAASQGKIERSLKKLRNRGYVLKDMFEDAPSIASKQPSLMVLLNEEVVNRIGLPLHKLIGGDESS